MIPAIDYTPPVNQPATVQVDYCDSTRLDTQWHEGWVPVYGSPYFCPTKDAAPLFTNPRPVSPATVTGWVERAPQIADAIIAYPSKDGTIVVVTLDGRTRRFLA